MDYTKLPQTITASNPQNSFIQWSKDPLSLSTYNLNIHGLEIGITGFVHRYNNRGMTLNTWSLNGEEVSFTLKPSQFAFIYEEDKTK